jgi:hypothetical protein
MLLLWRLPRQRILDSMVYTKLQICVVPEGIESLAGLRAIALQYILPRSAVFCQVPFASAMKMEPGNFRWYLLADTISQ